jgi:hypothetical protein
MKQFGGFCPATRKSVIEQTEHMKETSDSIGFVSLQVLAIPA